MQHDK